MYNVREYDLPFYVAFFLFLTLSFFLHPLKTTASSSPGGTVESFEVETLEGRNFDLRDHLNRGPVLLNFGATWCGPCRREWPVLDRFYRNDRSDSLSVLVIDVGESRETIREHWNKEGYELPVTTVDNSFSDRFGVDTYPTNLIVGPYGRIVYRGEGFDSRIVDILRSYAPFKVAVPLDASAMRPEEFQSPPESDRQAHSPARETIDLSSDSPVEALQSLKNRDGLPPLGDGLSDTTLRSVNLSLKRILDGMRSRNRYEVAYGSFEERNPELGGMIRNIDSPPVSVKPRQAYRSLSKAIQSLRPEISEALFDQLLDPYQYIGFWKSVKVDSGLYRFERQHRGTQFTARRDRKEWRFTLPFEPFEAYQSTTVDTDLPESLAMKSEDRWTRGFPDSVNLHGGLRRDGFGYQLDNRDKEYRFEAVVPSLAGVQEGREEVNDNLYERDYLTLSSLVARASRGKLFKMDQQNRHHSNRHHNYNGRARTKIYHEFTLPDGTSIEAVSGLKGTFHIDVPDGLTNHVFQMDRPYRHREIGGRTVEVLRFGNRGLILLFEKKPENVWSLQAFDVHGGLQGYRSSSRSDKTWQYELDGPASFLRLIRFDSTRKKTVSFNLPVSREVRTLPLRTGESMSFEKGRIEVRDRAERPQQGDRKTHVKLAVTADRSFLTEELKAINGLTSEGKSVAPETIDWDIQGDDFDGMYRILRFGGPVETLRFELKGAQNGL